MSVTRYDHITLWVSNSRQAAMWYSVHLGFDIVACRPKSSRYSINNRHAYLLQQDQVRFILESPTTAQDSEMLSFLIKHGEGVKDVAFEVQDLGSIMKAAQSRGAVVVENITTLESEKDGVILYGRVQTFGDTTHTLVDRSQYSSRKLWPGFENVDPVEFTNWNDHLNPTKLQSIDHFVGNLDVGTSDKVTEWYRQILSLHKFWSVDDSLINSGTSGLHCTFIKNDNGNVQIPIIEPSTANAQVRTQNQEFLDYYGSAGVQHIALLTDNIVESVANLKSRGVQFLSIPHAYYKQLRDRLETSAHPRISEDLDTLEKLQILIDYDENGYLLQIFAKPNHDRPTMFFEIIQRRNHTGFGAGNINALFKAVEEEQALRGNLYKN